MKQLATLPRRLFASIGLQWYLAVLLALDAFMVLRPVIEHAHLGRHGAWLADLLHLVDDAGLVVLPQIVVATGLATMAIGIVLRARVAWVLSILLLVGASAISALGGYRSDSVFVYTIVLVVALLYYWRHFNRTSIAASSLFAVLSIASLLVYATFGVLYLGDEFAPPIHDLATAVYFSIVSMSTVGYGDIVPHTPTARLFTASVIVLGITVFATSISAFVGPVIGGNLKRIVKGGLSNVIRKHHYLIVGATPVAHAVHDGLRKRGYAVTVVVPAGVEHNYAASTDLVVGDATDPTVLESAGAATARAVLALRSDDAENAFIILAIRELAPTVRTVALVNQQRNLERLRLLKPDMVFSPQQLAGELLASTLNDEPVDKSVISHLLFGTQDPA
ncbi:voltage-gated potassium channel protein [Burkholderia stagnalis]